MSLLRKDPIRAAAPPGAPSANPVLVWGGNVIRRAIDLVLAIPALIAVSPAIAIGALLVRLDSPGKAIYRQRRIGRDGEAFELYKLRTMIAGSDPVGIGTVVTEDDPRVTRVGRWLRRFSVDEFPNLINVIRGEMAIVGPRPTIPAQVELYSPRQRRRLEVKPGITGWAQVNGRAGIPWEERIELDVYYIEHRSLALDLRILGRTARLLITGHGLHG